jgi:uncharacterized linocin/CFP29 family protein
LLAFRRAANTLAQVEDHIVFNGYQTPAPGVGAVKPGKGTVATTGFADEFVASDHPAYSDGLSVPTASTKSTATANKRPSSKGQAPQSTNAGELIVTEIVKAIGELEAQHHPGPFAVVLGETLFVQAYTPNSALVLPADRIKPLVNGPLLRSARLSANRGVVVSLASGAIDIVAATPAKVQFLQVTDQARYLFRVYERVVLRIKDATDTAVHDFEINGL